MNLHRGLFAAALGLCSAVAFNGCALFTPVADHPKEYVFIGPSPKPSAQSTGSGKLRLAVKDNIDLRGTVTTAGSGYVAKTAAPAKRDAACLAIARERDVEIVGKTNVTEFALGVSGMNAYFGTPISPFDENGRRVSGGSSSGSAVAVATGLADVAFGTDTAGSIRVPAACCGVVGLKTTKGLVPLDGVFPISPDHLDTVGPLARDIEHTAIGMDLLQRGFMAQYRRAVASEPPRSITIGRLYLDGTDPAIDRAIDDALARAGLRTVRLPDELKTQWVEAERNGNIIAVADAWLNDRDFLGKKGVTPTTKAAIRLGEIQYPAPYAQALVARERWQRTLRRTFQRVDFIALPTLQKVPPRIPFFGLSALFEGRLLLNQNTVAVNFAGNPALAIPVPLPDAPVPMTSLQLVGPNRSEARLLNAGRIIMAPQREALATAARRN